MPFLTESMYQNLVVRGAGQGDSIHLTDFPEVDESLIDYNLSSDMGALLRLISLGSAARNSVKIKVRQPLAEMKVQGDERVRRAVERFPEQIREELNIKRITFHEPGGPGGELLHSEKKPNQKSLGAKYGSRSSEVKAAIEAYTSRGQGVPLRLKVSWGEIDIGAEDVLVERKPPDNNWAKADDNDIELLIDVRLSEELKQEGMAREVVRHVQNARKEAELQMEDRIVLYLTAESPSLQKAIAAHRDYISTETLATEWATRPLDGEAYRTKVKVDGQPLLIELRRIAS